MKRLKVTHFLQDPSYCAVAACAVVANYFNPKIDYLYAKEVADKMSKEDISEEGIETEESARLLNLLGFHKVTVASSDIDVFDYEWENYGRRKMTESLKYAIAHKKCEISKDRLKKGLYDLIEYANNAYDEDEEGEISDEDILDDWRELATATDINYMEPGDDE